jgi:hypothetical protein
MEVPMAKQPRGWLLALILLPMLAAHAAWGQAMQPATDIGAAERAAIRQVVSDQMAAFQRDDAEAAFAFAAPNIQDMFGTPERFIAMVRQSYAPVYRPSEVKFDALVRVDGRVTQPVHVVGPDGVPQLALYFMELQPDGRWRITGCVLTVEPGAST